MKPKYLLNDYLNGRISGDELQAWLANDSSREARQTLNILNLDDSARNALREFAPSSEAAQRLAEKVSDVQSWIESDAQAKPPASKHWFSKLVPAEAIGHSRSPRKTKNRVPRKKDRKRTAQSKIQRSKKHSARSSKHKKK